MSFQFIPPDPLGRLRAGIALAQRIPASRETRDAWTVIAPFRYRFSELAEDEDPPTPAQAAQRPLRFTILKFEVERGYDYDKYYLEPEYIHNKVDVIANSEEELLRVLRDQFGIASIADFVEPRDCDCPL